MLFTLQAPTSVIKRSKKQLDCLPLPIAGYLWFRYLFANPIVRVISLFTRACVNMKSGCPNCQAVSCFINRKRRLFVFRPRCLPVHADLCCSYVYWGLAKHIMAWKLVYARALKKTVVLDIPDTKESCLTQSIHVASVDGVEKLYVWYVSFSCCIYTECST